MKKKSIILFFLCFSSLAFSNFKGKVYNDLNKNKIFDKGDIPVEGVLVTNSNEVVKTNKKGEFILPNTSRERFIYISTPNGYDCLNKFYINVSEKVTNYDFPLTAIKKKETANFLQITDTETFDYNDWVENVKEYSKNEQLDFIVHTGDICYEKGLNFHAKNINTEKMGLPVKYCIGNHDLVKGKYGEELYESLFGPVWYSFDYANTHFVVLPMKGGDHKPSYTLKEILTWLKNDLAHMDKNKSLVVFNHDLWSRNEKFVFESEGVKVDLNEYNLAGWIYGHWHNNFTESYNNGQFKAVCSSPPDKGGIDHSPSNFILYSIGKDKILNLEERYSYLHNHIELVSPSQDIKNVSNNKHLSVVVYNSASAAKSVSYRIKDKTKDWTTLNQENDWRWTSDLSSSNLKGDQEIEFKIEYRDGITVIKSEKVEFENSVLDIKLGKTIDNHVSNIELNSEESYSRLNLHQVWNNSILGKNWMANPVLKDQIIVCAGIDDFKLKDCGLSAFNAKTGKKLWEFKTKNSIKNSISIYENTVLATDAEGICYAVDLKSGKLNWKKPLGQKFLPAYVSGNVIEKGIFYTGAEKYLQAIDIKSGKTLWTNDSWSGGEGTASTMTVVDDYLITGSHWRAVYIHDKKTGKVVKKHSDNKMSSCSSSQVYDENYIYFISADKIVLLDRKTLEVSKTFELNMDLHVSTSPVLTDKYILLGTSKEGLIAIDKKNGELVWKVQTEESLVYSAPYKKPMSSAIESTASIYKGNVFVGATDGYIYQIKLSTGELLGKYTVGSPIFSSVIISGNMMYVNDFSGNLSAFHLGVN